MTDQTRIQRLGDIARAAGQATDLVALLGDFARLVRTTDGPLAIRALPATAAPGVVRCVFAADTLAEGRQETRPPEFDASVLQGTGYETGADGATTLDPERLGRARAGVPTWARAGVWLPLPGCEPVLAGVAVLGARPGGPSRDERAFLEAAARIVAGHAARLLTRRAGAAAADARPSLASRLSGEPDAFQALIEHSHDATLLLDGEATILYASPAAERILGIPAAAQVGRYGLDLVHPDDLPELRAQFQRVQERAGSLLRGRARARRADGAWRWLNVTMTNLLEDPAVEAVVVNYVDVSDQVEAQRALERTERHWRELLTHSSDVITRIDRHGVVRYLNAAIEAATGYDAEQLVGTDAFAMLHDADRQRVRAEFERVMRGGGAARVTYRLRHADGSLHWWEAVASRGHGGEAVPELIVNARDVTEQRAALDDAERQRKLLAAALDALPGPFYLFDRAGRYVLWNDALERATGADAETIAATGPTEFIAERDRERVAQAIETALATGQATVEAHLVGNGDDEVPYLFTGRRVEIDGKAHVVGMGIDIGEHVRANERVAFQARLLAQVHDAVLASDVDGRVSYWNPGAERLFGWSREEAIGRPLSELTVAGDAVARRPAIFDELRDAGEWAGIVDARDKDGRVFPIRTSVARLEDARGEPAGFVTVASDDTERQRREQERHRLGVDLAERVKELRVLHDAARYFEDEDAPLPQILRRLAERLPHAWRHTEDARARVEVGPDAGEVDGFARTPWIQTESLRTANGTRVRIEVAYRHEHEEADEGPFLREERSVLVSLCQMLRAYLERRHEREVSARLAERLGRQVDRLAALQGIDAAIIASNNLSTTLEVVFEQVLHELGVDAVDVLLYDETQEALVFAYGAGFRTHLIEKSRVPLGAGHVGRAAQARKSLYLPDARGVDPPFQRMELLEREGFVSYAALPLIAKGELKGLLGIFHRTRLEPDDEWWDFATALAQQTAIAIDNWQLLAQVLKANGSLEEAYDATIVGWARALDLRDEETAGHSARVTETTVALAQRFGIAGDELRFVRWGALLHDIGKMGVPDGILLKPGPLDEEERATMQRHADLAYDLLSPIAFLRNAVDIPYAHHERFDGGGYPRGLAGTQIPLAARIFAVVDVFDALTSDRPYRPAWSREAVLAHIRRESGRHFDPEVVRAFLAHIDEPRRQDATRGDAAAPDDAD